MNNDLISRKTMKEMGATCFARRNENGKLEAIISLDNAPTVELERVKNELNNELNELNPEKPQGEWIDYSNEGYVECPFCGSATNCEDNKDELHYCWNCGAYMRKGGTE